MDKLMRWQLGWVLNTLNYQIEKKLKETIYASESYKVYRWNLLESQIIQWSRNPILYIILIFMALVLLLTAGHLLVESIIPLKSDKLLDWSWLSDWQKALLSVQVTLVGVVLPLAISLVGFLVQKKTASKAIWSLYRQYSGFLFIGFSCLSALVFIMVGPYLETLLETVSYSLWCVFSFVWVSVNILLIGWFIRATFLIVHEPSRDALLLRYTINESFTASIRKRLSKLIPEDAVHSKLVSNPKGSNIEVSTLQFSQEKENIISTNYRTPRYVSGIKFRFLNAAVFFAKKQNMKSQYKREITIPLSIDNHASKKHVLASCRGFNPSFLVKMLLRLSYRFSKKKPFKDDLVDDILFSLIGSASDDLRERNIMLFEKSVERLAKWHCSVNDALTFVNNKNQDDNWLLLPSSSLWSRTTYLDQILSEYYHLTIQAVAVLPESVSFYENMAHLQLKVNNWGKGDLPEKIVKELIDSSYLAWGALVHWASTTTKVPGTLIYNQYENALLAYVGAWESWPMYLEPRSRRLKNNIKSVPLYLQHLRCTGQQIVTALRSGEEIAAEWATDMLLNWFTTISLDEYSQEKFLWIHELITANILERDSTSDIWQFILNQNNYDEKSAAQLAMENAWIDVRLVCATYIQAHEKERDSGFLRNIIQALIDGKRLKPTGGIDRNDDSLSTGADILAAYIRQRCYWEDEEKSYGNWLDSIVKNFSRIDEPKRVSGRIYSSVDANDVRSLQVEYVKVAIVKSNRQWKLPQRWIEIIFSPMYKQRHRDNLLNDLEDWLDIAQNHIDKDIKKFTEERVANFIASIKEIFSLINNRGMDEIRKAPIDKNRLLDFGRSASKSGFSKDTGSPLLRLFDEIIKSNVIPDKSPKIFKILGYSKSEVSENIEVNRASNEDKWIDDAVNQHISDSLFYELCALPRTVGTEFESNLDLLKRLSTDIRQHSSELGDMSVFIGPWNIHRLLNKIIFTLDDYKSLNVEQREGFGNSYICHLEECAVYQIPSHRDNFSLLVPNSIFESIKFTKFSEDRLVDVAYEDLDEETLKLTLVFKYYMEIKFGSGPIYGYISPKGIED
jgi:hypothetical protein